MSVTSQLFYPLIEQVCTLKVQDAKEHINTIKAGPNLDLITQSQGKGLLIKYFTVQAISESFAAAQPFPIFVTTRAVCGDCPLAMECPVLFWIFMLAPRIL